MCDFCLSRDYWVRYNNWLILKKLLKLIWVKTRYKATLIFVLTFFEQKTLLTHCIDLLSQIALKKEWKLRTHLMTYPSNVNKLTFPAGREIVTLKQSMLFSISLEKWKNAYQGRAPPNCEKTKFVTQFWRVELLNFKGMYFY